MLSFGVGKVVLFLVELNGGDIEVVWHFEGAFHL